MAIGADGQRITVGDYVKIPYSQISGATVGNQTSYIGVCLSDGGSGNISGVYLTSTGTTSPFAGVAGNQCFQLGQASGPANQGRTGSQN